jgi:signal transduction histidine kinase
MKNKPTYSQKPKTNEKGEIEVSSIADFVNAVSHDLKNPLTTIKAYAQIAKKRLQDVGDDKTVKYIDKIEEQSDRATQLITELLDISQISGGKIEIHKKSFRLDKLINETIGDLQITINTHKIIGDCKSEIKVIADKERVRRVFLNLLTNAVKYSPNADKVIVGIDNDKHNAFISVQDFGVGIPITKQKNLFDPYFRVKEGGKNIVEGYGLGLPIVKRIVEAHDGKVWFESKKGKGSIFYFSLPLNN